MSIETLLKAIEKLEHQLGRAPKRWELANLVCHLVEDDDTLRAQLSRARRQNLVHEHGDGCVRLTRSGRAMLSSWAEEKS